MEVKFFQSPSLSIIEVKNCSYYFRNYNLKFPDENVLQFLHGLDPVQSQSCLNLNFGSYRSGEKFSFPQHPMTPENITEDESKNFFRSAKHTHHTCSIVSIGRKHIKVVKDVKMFLKESSLNSNSHWNPEFNPTWKICKILCKYVK